MIGGWLTLFKEIISMFVLARISTANAGSISVGFTAVAASRG